MNQAEVSSPSVLSAFLLTDMYTIFTSYTSPTANVDPPPSKFNTRGRNGYKTVIHERRPYCLKENVPRYFKGKTRHRPA